MNQPIREIRDILRRREPLMLAPTTSVRDAGVRMRTSGLGAVLVGKDNQLMGIFTGRDAIARVIAEARDPAQTTLADVMTPDPTTIDGGQTAIDALRLMSDGGFRHLPVTENGCVIGLVLRSDFRDNEQELWAEEKRLRERVW
jgi:CBS domain-containing protein